MNDILDLIISRRSIKQYFPKYVSWELISRILEAGRHAPCSGNIQNWKFIVFIEPERKQKLVDLTHEQYELSAAGALIVICAELEKAERYYGQRGEELYSIQNCAAAAQNMLLEAASLGLGSTWVGGFDEEGVKELCRLPEKVVPQVIIAVGFPKDIPSKPPKYPLETLVYFHSWRNKMRDPAKYMHEIATILSRKFTGVKEKLKQTAASVVSKVKED
ncbi:MAG TPA: nitroreductase family protein [Candidatus Nanoarchaeia archaeon]|nr:nitroreductase family protein [Candidatus Nanoarchaeia archaeon]